MRSAIESPQAVAAQLASSCPISTAIPQVPSTRPAPPLPTPSPTTPSQAQAPDFAATPSPRSRAPYRHPGVIRAGSSSRPPEPPTCTTSGPAPTTRLSVPSRASTRSTAPPATRLFSTATPDPWCATRTGGHAHSRSEDGLQPGSTRVTVPGVALATACSIRAA